uniref:Ycf34 n=1 Tax=Lophocladia kuetzingii TaxID=675577 RepID=A0A1Z1MPC9_9FLOR|nr:hypothetical protein [Lophocladia kuetzingii]ARW67611.1 hypothetical protein [Lophocladia kuetzingii]
MCICINCRHIHKCKMYAFIEEQHNNKNRPLQSILFSPNFTIINVNINKKDNILSLDWDLIECLSFIEKPGYWINQN